MSDRRLNGRSAVVTGVASGLGRAIARAFAAEGAALVDAAVAELGGLDVLVNNAAIEIDVELLDTTEDQLDRERRRLRRCALDRCGHLEMYRQTVDWRDARFPRGGGPSATATRCSLLEECRVDRSASRFANLVLSDTTRPFAAARLHVADVRSESGRQAQRTTPSRRIKQH
jgi:hypothetical protein